MKYVSGMNEYILDKKQVKNLVHKCPIILFLIRNENNQTEEVTTNNNYQFIFSLKPALNFEPKKPIIIGIYNGVFGVMNKDMLTESFKPNHILETPLSNQFALYLTQELLFCPTKEKSYLESMIATMGDLLIKKLCVQKELDCELKMGLTPFQIKKIIHYIKKNIDRPILTLELAKVARLSVHHFIRVFKKTTGETPHQFIMRIKLMHAKKLLISTEESIIQVGMGVGCNNPSHFSKLFKTNFGIPPLKFRKAYHIDMLSA